MRVPYTVLVVDDDVSALSGMLELLRDAGYQATGAATFDTARELLAVNKYDLLVTDVRLRAFNGLRLVQACRVNYPQMAVLVVTGYPEPLLELEAGRYGASLLMKPISPPVFLDKVAEVLATVRRERRWPRKKTEVTAKADEAPALVVDVNYGGLRLDIQTPDREPPPRFEVTVPEAGLTFEVEPVWSDRMAAGHLICGATLVDEESLDAWRWRGFVDEVE